MTKKLAKFPKRIKKNINQRINLDSNAKIKCPEILDFLQPGSFATIENQPNDLPPFLIINCKGGRCWIRQQSWGRYVHWEIPHHRLKSA